MQSKPRGFRGSGEQEAQESQSPDCVGVALLTQSQEFRLCWTSFVENISFNPNKTYCFNGTSWYYLHMAKISYTSNFSTHLEHWNYAFLALNKPIRLYDWKKRKLSILGVSPELLP